MAVLHSLSEKMNLSVIVLSLLVSVGLGLAGVHAALSIVFWLALQRKPATVVGTGSMR